jgi:tetratricopeptide (TPR) repeat protein
MGETSKAEPRVDRSFLEPPDPARADSLDAVADALRQLKVWAGDPSYDTIKERINAAWRQAASHRATGDRDGETWVLNGLGEAAHATGRFGEARGYFDAAAAIAAEIGLRDQEARAHAGLALAHQSLDQSEQARVHNEKALTWYADLGMPEADEIRTRMGVSLASRG